jgi:hypothetical protein
MILLFDLAAQVDQYLDSTEPEVWVGEIEAVLWRPEVQLESARLLHFLRSHGERGAIHGLAESFVSQFPAYLSVLRQARQSHRYEDALAAALIDNGEWLASVMGQIAAFNGTALGPDLTQDFTALGMVGKGADDLTDVVRDHRKNRINSLLFLVSETSEEAARFEQGLRSGARFSLSWWRANCPETMARYEMDVADWFARISRPRMRILANVLLLPTQFGYDYDRLREG